ncbi:MAG TPA: alpha/beta hydrolase [Candidatus Dormibacteraeota bacterium]|nr:alpha/beta hydrolase [Candidatus Dormibacteraeota bacterium]
MNAPDFEVGKREHRLAGWTSGQGPTVVVLHGGPGLSDYTYSLLPELVDSYTVVRFQQRGLAPSTTAGPFDVETQVADTVSVLDGLGLDRPLIIGHSWGGHLAMHLMAAHPDRVAGALVIDPLGAVPDGGEADLSRILGERVTPEAAARSEELDERALRGEGTAADQIEGLSLVWPGYFAVPATAPPMPSMEISVAAYSDTFKSIREHFERQTLVSRLPQISVPTHFLLGAQSPIPNSHGLASAALIPRAEVEVLPGCGHFPWLEQPGSVRAVLDRLRARVVAVSS